MMKELIATTDGKLVQVWNRGQRPKPTAPQSLAVINPGRNHVAILGNKDNN